MRREVIAFLPKWAHVDSLGDASWSLTSRSKIGNNTANSQEKGPYPNPNPNPCPAPTHHIPNPNLSLTLTLAENR